MTAYLVGKEEAGGAAGVAGSVEGQEVRHPHALLPPALAEIIRNVGLCHQTQMSIKV